MCVTWRRIRVGPLRNTPLFAEQRAMVREEDHYRVVEQTQFFDRGEDFADPEVNAHRLSGVIRPQAIDAGLRHLNVRVWWLPPFRPGGVRHVFIQKAVGRIPRLVGIEGFQVQEERLLVVVATQPIDYVLRGEFDDRLALLLVSRAIGQELTHEIRASRIHLHPAIPELPGIVLRDDFLQFRGGLFVVVDLVPSRPLVISVTPMEVLARALQVRNVGNQSGVVAGLEERLRHRLIFVIQLMPARRLDGFVLVEIVVGHDPAAGHQHASDRDCRHPFRIAVLEDHAVLGELVQLRALDKTVPAIRLQVVRAERVRVEEDEVLAVSLVSLVGRPLPLPARQLSGGRGVTSGQARRSAGRGCRGSREKPPAGKLVALGIRHICEAYHMQVAPGSRR